MKNSHYGLNSRKFKQDWITPLSHKNDGYQSPVVINPMRTEGDIKINREEDLMNQRFLSNILEPVEEGSESSLRNILGNKKVSQIRIGLNRGKLDKKVKDDLDFTMISEEYYAKVMNEVYRVFEFSKDQVVEKRKSAEIKLAEKYIVRKLFLIAGKYGKYDEYLKNKSSIPLVLNNLPSLIGEIKKDASHIVFKIKQAIYFLKYRHIEFQDGNNIIEIEKLSRKINSIKALQSINTSNSILNDTIP